MRAVHVVPIAVVLGCSGGERRPADRPPGPVVRAPSPRTNTAVAPTARHVAEETSIKTRSGASLQVPGGWWLTEAGTFIVLEDPDQALKAWFVERRDKDGASAIAAAWQLVAPGFDLAPAAAPDRPPPTDGWDAVMRVSYDTRSVGERVVEAVARRHGETTYVVLVDGGRAVMARRRAQLEQALASLRPEGMREESFAGQTPAPLDGTRASELDRFIRDALARLEVPGAAVAVVHGHKVVYERVFGVRALGKKAPVTPKTLFMMGSVTKPMTTMMEAALVDAGLFDWDTPVTSVLPSFALGDPELTRKVLMWHMSCACTGMPPNVEYLFEYAKVSPEQLVASMKSMKPTTELGEAFQYSNLMVAAGGYAAAHTFAPRRALGVAYGAAMRKTIFGPIGMKSTTLDFDGALRGEHAMPHGAAVDGSIRSIPVDMERNVVPIAPAGAVWSNLRDMERYVMTELAGGLAPNGTRVVSQKNLEARRIVRIGDPQDGYGLGLGVGQFHGLTLLGHDGGAFGFGTEMFMLPDPGIAIIVLTNVRNDAPTEHLPFNAVVRQRIIEAIFAGARPLAAVQLDYFANGRARAAARAVEHLERVPDPARLSKLAGTYRHDNLGTVTLEVSRAGTTFDAGEWKSAMGQRTRDTETETETETMTLVFLDPPFAGKEIAVGGDQAAPTIVIRHGQDTYVFTRHQAGANTTGRSISTASSTW